MNWPAATIPVPCRAIDSGLSEALSVTVTAAFSAAFCDGVNAMVIVQLPCAGTCAPQVSLSVKSAAFAPVTAMLVIFNGSLPLLVSVTVGAVFVSPTYSFPNDTIDDDKLTVGPVICCTVSVPFTKVNV